MTNHLDHVAHEQFELPHFMSLFILWPIRNTHTPVWEETPGSTPGFITSVKKSHYCSCPSLLFYLWFSRFGFARPGRRGAYADFHLGFLYLFKVKTKRGSMAETQTEEET